MLRSGDLALVAEIFREPRVNDAAPSAFENLVHPDGELWLADLWRLQQSAECAFHAGEMEGDVPNVLSRLVETSRDRPKDTRLVAPSHTEAWRGAIAATTVDPLEALPKPAEKSRQQVVGEAVKRLKSRGRRVQVHAQGPQWDGVSLRHACAAVDHLVSRLGGEAVLNQCGSIRRESSGIFEDIWLLGDRGLGMGQVKQASIPHGWLVGLAAKHMHRPNTCRNPAVAWKTLVTHARDIAASYDCQRYSKFEGITGITPGEIDPTISEAIGWRALFFTPQAPRLLLLHLQDAFRDVLDAEEDRAAKPVVMALFREMIGLTENLHAECCTRIATHDAQRAVPLLFAQSFAAAENVNAKYSVPVRSSPREDTRFVLFDGPANDFVVRPLAMAVHAFCETVFGVVWERLPAKRAEKIIGDVLEAAIAKACEGKAEQVWKNEPYGPKRTRQEIDVATRTGASVTLIETKAKIMTTDAQYGTSGKFYEDYARSFLPMAEQLARHNRNLRAGATSLATAEEADALSLERIAVSPVSFGPIGDRIATTALMAALPGVEIHPLREDNKTRKATDSFNNATSKLMKELAQVVPENADGVRDLVPFFMTTHWLDLGQLLVALDRAERVADALRPIRNISTGSRDFWTEFSQFLDLQARASRVYPRPE